MAGSRAAEWLLLLMLVVASCLSAEAAAVSSLKLHARMKKAQKEADVDVQHAARSQSTLSSALVAADSLRHDSKQGKTKVAETAHDMQSGSKELASKDEEEDDEDDDGEDGDDRDEDRSTKATREAALSKSVNELEEELAANLAERSEMKEHVEFLSDAKRSSKEIDAKMKLVANQTESKALATMLGKMWKELRMFEMPSFSNYTDAELVELKKEGEDLEAAIGAAKVELEVSSQQKSPEANLVQKQAKGTKLVAKVPAEAAAKGGTLLQAKAAAGQTPQKPFSVWHMSGTEQQTVWSGTAVYLCFGLVVGFLYNRARWHAKALLPQRDYRTFPQADAFSFGLFDCFSDTNVCIIGCCCPCLRWADTLDRQGLLSYWKAFGAMFGLMLLHFYSYILSVLAVATIGAFFRQKLYQHFKIDSKSVFRDCLIWLFCQPCAIIQEAREASVQRSADV